MRCVLLRVEQLPPTIHATPCVAGALDEPDQVVQRVEADLVVARQDGRQRHREAGHLPDAAPGRRAAAGRGSGDGWPPSARARNVNVPVDVPPDRAAGEREARRASRFDEVVAGDVDRDWPPPGRGEAARCGVTIEELAVAGDVDGGAPAARRDVTRTLVESSSASRVSPASRTTSDEGRAAGSRRSRAAAWPAARRTASSQQSNAPSSGRPSPAPRCSASVAAAGRRQ